MPPLGAIDVRSPKQKKVEKLVRHGKASSAPALKGVPLPDI